MSAKGSASQRKTPPERAAAATPVVAKVDPLDMVDASPEERAKVAQSKAKMNAAVDQIHDDVMANGFDEERFKAGLVGAGTGYAKEVGQVLGEDRKEIFLDAEEEESRKGRATTKKTEPKTK